MLAVLRNAIDAQATYVHVSLDTDSLQCLVADNGQCFIQSSRP